MQIAVVGLRDIPSPYYRFLQFEKLFADADVQMTFIPRDALNSKTLDVVSRADWLIIQSCLFSYWTTKQLLGRAKRVWYDFDDAIYTIAGRRLGVCRQFRRWQRFRWLVRAADVVTVPNQFLANVARRLRGDVDVVPMSLDLDYWKPSERRESKRLTSNPNRQFVMGWAGSPWTLDYLCDIEHILEDLLQQQPSSCIRVLSGQKPRLRIPFEYHPFRVGAENEFTQRLDVGLLPLKQEEFAQGKSPIKAIQYIACGKPVIGNVFGGTSEILKPEFSVKVKSESDWNTAVNDLISNPNKYQRMSVAARRFAERHHDRRSTGQRMIERLRAA